MAESVGVRISPWSAQKLEHEHTMAFDIIDRVGDKRKAEPPLRNGRISSSAALYLMAMV